MPEANHTDEKARTTHAGSNGAGRSSSPSLYEKPKPRERTLYRARDWGEIERYVTQHFSSWRELERAARGVRKFFGDEVLVRLSVERPVDGDGVPLLFAFIRPQGGTKDAYGKLRQMDDWCGEHLPLDFTVVFDLDLAHAATAASVVEGVAHTVNAV